MTGFTGQTGPTQYLPWITSDISSTIYIQFPVYLGNTPSESFDLNIQGNVSSTNISSQTSSVSQINTNTLSISSISSNSSIMNAQDCIITGHLGIQRISNESIDISGITNTIRLNTNTIHYPISLTEISGNNITTNFNDFQAYRIVSDSSTNYQLFPAFSWNPNTYYRLYLWIEYTNGNYAFCDKVNLDGQTYTPYFQDGTPSLSGTISYIIQTIHIIKIDGVCRVFSDMDIYATF
jgi:hypothetical protein